jgi:hypothetical protein
MKARGAYRATFESIDDDRDWRKLSPLAKATFDTLKRRLGQYGINIVALETLPRIVNCSAADMDGAFAELEAPKPGREHGWIRREEDVVWIVNGLRFEPTLFVEGLKPNENHRMGAARHGRQLHQLTRASIVSEFMAYYGLVDVADPAKSDAIPNGSTNGIGSENGMGGGITESESESETESEIESESDARANGSAPPAPGSATPAAPSKSIGYNNLPSDVVEFGARYYGDAPAERRRKIASQLLRLARGEGIRYKGSLIKAGSLGRLARKCRDVLDGNDVRNRDAAIAVLFVKLGDSTDLSDEQRRRDETHRAEETRQTAHDTNAAEAWLEDNPAVAGAVDEELERQGFAAGGARDGIKTMTRTWVRRGLLLTAWRDAGAPELAHA